MQREQKLHRMPQAQLTTHDTSEQLGPRLGTKVWEAKKSLLGTIDKGCNNEYVIDGPDSHGIHVDVLDETPQTTCGSAIRTKSLTSSSPQDRPKSWSHDAMRV